jgi:Protein  of unknown function (DUF3018)
LFVSGCLTRKPPDFREDVERQARLLRGAPEETEAPDFIEAAADWGDSDS